MQCFRCGKYYKCIPKIVDPSLNTLNCQRVLNTLRTKDNIHDCNCTKCGATYCVMVRPITEIERIAIAL